MKFQDRDVEIIKFINENTGATIDQISKLFFNKNYELSRRRLVKLKSADFLKSAWHPILNKITFFNNKLPSYHSLILNDVQVALKEYIIKFSREAQLGNIKVDAMALIKKESHQLLIFEVDIFNKTNSDKVKQIREYCNNELRSACKVILISKNKIDDPNVFDISINIEYGNGGIDNIYRELNKL